MTTRLSRRQALQGFALLLAGGGGALLSACSPTNRPTAGPTFMKAGPTSAPAATSTSGPAATPAPAATPTPRPIPPRPSVIKVWPEGPSTVVQARYTGVWQDNKLRPAALRQMLDASIVALTGLAGARSAWGALFRPEERIGIKVNAFGNSLIWTHESLVRAVTESLQEAGIPGEQIMIYDATSEELVGAGYTLNLNNPGVRCLGTDADYVPGWSINGSVLGLSKRLLDCDALINMPVLKMHGQTGITFALKNHMGSVGRPDLMHGRGRDDLFASLAQLSALPEIQKRTRLVVGDVLTPCIQGEDTWPYWRTALQGDTLLLGHDPVAVDVMALRLWSGLVTAAGGDPKAANAIGAGLLASVARLGAGTDDAQNIKLTEITLP
jgi:hypothetical protein